MSSWLVNLRRASTVLNKTDKEDDLAICYKILKNETLFRSYCKMLKQAPPVSGHATGNRKDTDQLAQGKVEVLDLVEIVRKFCRSSTTEWFAMFT